MTENQKLRDALRYIEGVVYSVGGLTDCQIGEMLGEIQKVASKALSLPTADHIEDSLAMVQAAAPVDEREAFEKHMSDKFGYDANDFERVEGGSRYLMGTLENHLTTWQARAALQSSADAVKSEREACAELCETWNTAPGSKLAGAIRARGA